MTTILTKEKFTAKSILEEHICSTAVFAKYDALKQSGKSSEELYEWLKKELSKCKKLLVPCEPYYRLVDTDSSPFLKSAHEFKQRGEE